jgi:hypothetical protein
VTESIDLYDHEIDAIQKVWDQLRDRHQKTYRSYDAVEREIISRFAEIGLVAQVNWYSYKIGGVVQEGAAMPEVTITGRIEKHEFDHDQQVHEVVNNVLDIPGQEGVIKTDQGGAFKKFREEHGSAAGHDHHH